MRLRRRTVLAMLAAIFGSLTYSLVQGVKDASGGQANTFASSLADSADLLISARLMGVATKAQRLRRQKVWSTLGQPRKVVDRAGNVELWRPDPSAYPHFSAAFLEGRVANG